MFSTMPTNVSHRPQGGHVYEVLGPLRVDGNANPRRRMQRRLLALLLIDPGAEVPQDALIERLWSGWPPATAKNTLQAHMSELRRVIGRESVVSTPIGYRLVVDRHDVDVERFRQAVLDARTANGVGAYKESLEHGQHALAMWRGTPFMDLGDEPFTRPIVSALAELHAEAHELCAAALLEREAWGEAAALAENAVHSYPLREGLWEHLMVALHRGGRRAEALEVFRRARASLLDHGLSPSSRLADMHATLLRDDESSAVLPKPAPDVRRDTLRRPDSQVRSPLTWPFVGRTAELHEADRLIDDGRPGLVLVGPAGVGKSRLLHEIGSRAEQDGTATFTIRANASLARIPLGAMSALTPLRSDPVHAQFQRIVDAIIALGDGSPPLLLVDDAHHLDGPSTAVVTRAVESGDAHVVATVRSDLPTPETVTRWWTDSGCARMVLGRLEDSEIDALLEHVLGACTSDTQRRLRELAAGNPLHLRELVHAANDERAFVRLDGHWDLVGPVVGAARLTELVELASRRLGVGRGALEALAVLRPLARVVLEDVVGQQSLEILESAGLGYVSVDARGMGVVDVVHPLYAENLAVRLTAARKRELATSIASSLRRTEFPLEGDEIHAAMLLLDYSPDHLEPELASRACRQALARLDVDLALRFGGVATSGDGGGGSAESWALLGRATAYSGDVVEAERLLQKAQNIASDADEIVEIACERATHHGFGARNPEAAIALLDTTQERLGEVPAVARLRVERAVHLGLLGRMRKAVEELALVDQGTQSEATQILAGVVGTLARAMIGDLENVLPDIDALLPLTGAVRERLPFARDQLLTNKVMALTATGHVGDALTLAEAEWHRALDSDGLVSLWSGFYLLGLELAGQVTDVTEIHKVGRARGGADPFGVELVSAAITALALAQGGRTDEAVALLDQSDAEQAQAHPRDAVWWRRACAWTTPDRSEAAAAALAAGDAAVANDLVLWGALALYDAVRFDEAEVAASKLDLVAQSCRHAEMIESLAAAAAAHAAKDIDTMFAAARRLERHGAKLLAAESFAEVARLADSAQVRDSARSRQRVLLAECGLGALTNAPPRE